VIELFVGICLGYCGALFLLDRRDEREFRERMRRLHTAMREEARLAENPLFKTDTPPGVHL